MSAVRSTVAVLSGVILVWSIASGQNYPNKPICLLTSEPGGSQDFQARLLAPELSNALGQQIIVDNRTSIVSTETAIRSAPDGYTILVSGSSFWISPLFRKMFYDPIKSFVHLSFLTNSPNVIVLHPAVPIKSVKELIDTAKGEAGRAQLCVILDRLLQSPCRGTVQVH